MIVEIKATDWNAMTSKAVGRNVRRQIRQVWSYVEAKLEEGVDVCPAVLFEALPADPGRRELIEEMFHAEFIQVVWQDEA